MSWLDEDTCNLKFECGAGHVELFDIPAAEITEETYNSEQTCDCGLPSKYAGHEKRKIGLMGKCSYEQNGRKAFAIKSDTGTTYMSKTKYDYLQSGGVINPAAAYTPAYAEHLVATGNSNMLERVDLTKVKENPRAKVTKQMRAAKEQAAAARKRVSA